MPLSRLNVQKTFICFQGRTMLEQFQFACSTGRLQHSSVYGSEKTWTDLGLSLVVIEHCLFQFIHICPCVNLFFLIDELSGMLTILVTSIVTTNNNILAKSIADTNTITFMTILFTVYYIQQRSFFPLCSINKVNGMTVVEKMTKSL